jgi:hypothetical protein
MEEKIWEELAKAWPSSFVARQEVNRFSGGLVNPRTLANLDSLNKGPKPRIKMGRKVAYSKSGLIEWMKQHCRIESD